MAFSSQKKFHLDGEHNTKRKQNSKNAAERPSVTTRSDCQLNDFFFFKKLLHEKEEKSGVGFCLLVDLL